MPKQFNYPGVFEFLGRERTVLILALVFSVACTVTGILLPHDIQRLFMEPLMAKFQGMEFSVPGIFLNNLKSSGIIVLGGFILSIVSVIMTGINFIVLGSAMNYFAPERTPVEMLAMLIPHGILEIPAIILSLICGAYITKAIVFRMSTQPGSNERASDYLLRAAALFIMVIVPLLAAAALVEVFVSPHIAALAIK